MKGLGQVLSVGGAVAGMLGVAWFFISAFAAIVGAEKASDFLSWLALGGVLFAIAGLTVGTFLEWFADRRARR